MTIKLNTEAIDLSKVEHIANGDDKKLSRYLFQFEDLITERIAELKLVLVKKDRVRIRQLLHKMSPQLQFFGIKNVIEPIEKLEYEYKTLPFNQLNEIVSEIINKLEIALEEVRTLISTHFEDQRSGHSTG